MVLELHIWGPAFSLPSIDPECLAAVAYCTHAVPRGEWVLVASSDPSLSPTKELPALCDLTRWIGGFDNIVDYLRDYSGGQWDLDSGLSPQQVADSTAFSAFLHTHLSPLLLLSLYVSSTNYPLTRTAYTALLPAPTQYIIPPRLRATAKERTAHLNLTSLDLDSASEININNKPQDAAQIIPPSLRKPKPSVTAALKQGEQGARFQLSALTQAALAPLTELLGPKRWLLTPSAADQPTRLDCLALGYLSLALLPPVPQPWLADTLAANHAPLCAYVRASLAAMGGLDVRLEDAEHAPPEPETESTEEVPGSSRSSGASLPWRRPRARGFGSVAAVVLEGARAVLPWGGAKAVVLPPASAGDASGTRAASLVHPRSHSHTSPPSALVPHTLSVGVVALAVGACVAYAGGGREERGRGLRDMGEAGAVLAVVGGRRGEGRG